MDEETDARETMDAAVPDELKDKMVATAVTFLLNPKVRQSPLWQKKLFLRKKGLSDEGIAEAFRRAGISDSGSPQEGDPYLNRSVVPIAASAQVPSKWTKAREAVSTIVLIAGLSYGLYHFYQDTIRPWLFGLRKVDERLNEIESSVKDLQNKMVEALQKLHEKQTTETMTRNQDHYSVTEVKNEIQSLKGLLLNRKQFPPVPQTSPSLPAWQLSNSGPSQARATENAITENCTEQTSDGVNGDITKDINGEMGDDVICDESTSKKGDADSLFSSEKETDDLEQPPNTEDSTNIQNGAVA